MKELYITLAVFGSLEVAFDIYVFLHLPFWQYLLFGLFCFIVSIRGQTVYRIQKARQSAPTHPETP